MSDGSGSIPAAWFPDPDGGPGQRYWDGTQWTEHYHPPRTQQFAPPAANTQVGMAPAASAAPASAANAEPANIGPATSTQNFAPPAAGSQIVAPPPKKKRTALILSIIAGALVLLIGVPSFVIWGVPAIEASHGFTGAVINDPDWDYAYTEEMIGIERDHEFEYPVDFDYDEVEKQYPAPGIDESEGFYDRHFAFEVFADAALTKTVNATILQYDPGEPVVIMPGTQVGAYGPDMTGPFDIIDEEFGGWGLHAEYFLVRKIDAAGNLLDKPVVTRFTAKSEIEAPVVSFSTPANDGNLTFEWNAVEGATEYYVIRSNQSMEGGSRSFLRLAATSDLTWSSSETSYKNDVAPWLLEQNSEMRLYDYASSDTVELGWGSAGSSEGYDYGVIATDGTHFSPYNTYDAAEVSASLPFEVAYGASKKAKKWGKSGYIEGIENVQRELFFTSLDGATRSTSAYIDPTETVTKYKDRWVVSLRGRGTDLGQWIPILRRSEPDIDKAIARFNEEVESTAPTTGMPTIGLVSAPVDEFATPVKEAPATDYPIYGSNDYAKFLAQHFVGHTQVIDISDYQGKPGMPDVWDAANEARYQNPYAISVSGWSLRGNDLSISYTFSKDETVEIQKEINDKVNTVVGSVVKDSMSDKEKVTALNNWITKNAEYDYDALAGLEETGSIPDEYAHAWTAKGILVDGIGVCASYAYAFNALANAAGVETVVINGDVKEGGAHAWNKVKVSGKWRAVDPTWNDSPVANEFLMITDKQFTGPSARVQGTEWMMDLDINDYKTR